MSTLNDGRNEIRFNNSGGRCLLENWVEERAVKTIEQTDLNGDMTSSAQTFKDGHRGLLTRDTQATMNKKTTVQDSYRPPPGPQVRLVGAKQETLEKMLYEQVSKEVHAEFNQPPPQPDYKSTTQKDFIRDGFISTKPAPTANHNVVTEQPVTFWTEHRDVIHGVSQIKAGLDRPFNKNSVFSKPIEHCWDQPKPYEDEQVPNM